MNYLARTRIAALLEASPAEDTIEVPGWVRTKRDSKNVCFLELNDGSSLAGLQVIISKEETDLQPVIDRIQTGASVIARGRLVESPGKGQSVELACSDLTVVGESPADTYPLQKKRHSFEFLREIAHLRGRTNTFGAVMRVRNRLSQAVHQFYQDRGFLYLHTPIITAGDAEGAGALFQVTTLDLEKPPRVTGSGTGGPTSAEASLASASSASASSASASSASAGASAGSDASAGSVDYSRDFFGARTYLTVSGQLNAEAYATALDRVYTFGPTFRAENSNTTRHLAEFWMIEPEMAFCDLEGNMELAEQFVRYLLQDVLENCRSDMEFFDKRIEPGIIESLEQVAASRFQHMTYSEAVRVLEASADTFEFAPRWGMDLQTEHEKYLTEKHARGPVIVTDYPREIKAFYMKQNEDGKTVRAMDVLVPRLGEIIGGSQREDNLEALEASIDRFGLEQSTYQWYLDLRRYGSVPHAGFGLGFERLVRYVTGMQNVRDVIPFPRAVGSAEF